MTWKAVKKYLKERNRIVNIYNKGKKGGMEIIEAWNGILISEFEKDEWMRKMYETGIKQKLYKIVLTTPPETIYDYWGTEHVHCGWILPPDKNEKTQRTVFLEN